MPDNRIAGAEVDAMGTTTLDIRAQTRAVIENIRDILASAGAGLADVVEISRPRSSACWRAIRIAWWWWTRPMSISALSRPSR
ncbi:hypothetical protein [Lactiplantibacillus plantarum]|uniref:hypothetical protein n=1 Tax=Lactiplantibacillus plantarum TaxID=1590 RepID=UPI004045A182